MEELRNKKGFTLTEMLISVLLLGFVSIMVTVMTSAILNSTVTMREVAQAEILGSEALENMQSELRFGTNVVVAADGKAVSYTREDTDYTLDRNDDGKIIIKTKDTPEGTELFAGVSYGNLKVSELMFSLGAGADEGPNGSVVISVSIAYGKNVLWKGDVSVRPLNGSATAAYSDGAD